MCVVKTFFLHITNFHFYKTVKKMKIIMFVLFTVAISAQVLDNVCDLCRK